MTYRRRSTPDPPIIIHELGCQFEWWPGKDGERGGFVAIDANNQILDAGWLSRERFTEQSFRAWCQAWLGSYYRWAYERKRNGP